NQLANFALVEWDDNIAISGNSPADYWPVYSQRFDEQELAWMCHWHALPLNWHLMEYRHFLDARRRLLALVIKEGFVHIAHGMPAGVEAHDDRPIKEILFSGETTRIEF